MLRDKYQGVNEHITYLIFPYEKKQKNNILQLFLFKAKLFGLSVLICIRRQLRNYTRK